MNKHIRLAIDSMKREKEYWRELPKIKKAADMITPDVYKLMCQRIVELDAAIQYLVALDLSLESSNADN